MIEIAALGPVVFAGYPDRMESSFAANPGLSSRITHPIEFADDTHEELTAIAEVTLVQDAGTLADAERSADDALLRDCPSAQALIGLRAALDQRVPPNPVRAEVTWFLRAATGDRPLP